MFRMLFVGLMLVAALALVTSPAQAQAPAGEAKPADTKPAASGAQQTHADILTVGPTKGEMVVMVIGLALLALIVGQLFLLRSTMERVAEKLSGPGGR